MLSLPSRKAQGSSGTKLNLKTLAMVIIAIVALLAVILVIMPRISGSAFNESAGRMGRSTWDLLSLS